MFLFVMKLGFGENGLFMGIFVVFSKLTLLNHFAYYVYRVAKAKLEWRFASHV